MKSYSPRAAEFSQNINTNYIVVMILMILLIRDGQIDMNGLYFMNKKFSTSLYQYQGAKDTSRL